MVSGIVKIMCYTLLLLVVPIAKIVDVPISRGVDHRGNMMQKFSVVLSKTAYVPVVHHLILTQSGRLTIIWLATSRPVRAQFIQHLNFFHVIVELWNIVVLSFPVGHWVKVIWIIIFKPNVVSLRLFSLQCNFNVVALRIDQTLVHLPMFFPNLCLPLQFGWSKVSEHPFLASSTQIYLLFLLH